MSSRQARKVLKQQQEAQQKAISKEEKENEEEEPQQQTSKKGFFAMMSDESNSSEEEEDSDTEEQKKQEESEEAKAEKLRIEQARKAEEEELERKKKLKEDRQKQKKAKQLQQEEEEQKHLENILSKATEEPEESKDNSSRQQLPKADNESELTSVLQIIKSKLNYNKEISRYFKGAKLTDNKRESEENEEDEIMRLGIRNRRQARQYLLQFKKNKQTKQMNLVYDNKPRAPVPEKFICQSVGENKLGQTQYVFKPTQNYENLQQAYLTLQNQMDPQVVFDFVQQHPYHVDGLYNLYEFFNLQGKFKEANAMLEQILYIYEDSMGYEFGQILEDTKNRLCLSVEDNKYASTFFAALLKFIDLLGKKGCYRAALEFNKVLLKMNPEKDPAGGLLCIDYNSLSSKQYDYLLYFIKNFSQELYQNKNYSIQYMPNLIYSAALAKFARIMLPPKQKNKEVSEDDIPAIGTMIDFNDEDFAKAIDFSKGHIDENHKVLILAAILLYPKLIKQLCLANEFQKIALGHSTLKDWQKKPMKDMLDHQFFNDTTQPLYAFLGLQTQQDIDGLNKLMEIYVIRSKIVWKDNKIALWIKAAIGFILNQLERTDKPFVYDSLMEKLVIGGENNVNILPFSLNRYRILQKANFSDQVDRLDLNNIQDNVNMEPANQMPANFNPINTNQGFFQLLAQSILPWVHLPNQNNQQNNGNNNQDGQNNNNNNQVQVENIQQFLQEAGLEFDPEQDYFDSDEDDNDDENQQN